MIVLDEQTAESQRQLLRGWRVSVRKIGFDIVGFDIGRSGMDDDEILPLLLQLRNPTFCSRDYGFYRRENCHRRYAVVCLEVRQFEVAHFMRRLLSNPNFDTESKRIGAVVRWFHSGLTVWRLNANAEVHLPWP